MIKLKILYFAQLAEQVGTSIENLEIPKAVNTVGELQTLIAARDDTWANVGNTQIRMAVNHTLCKQDHAIHDGDEIAFFPPVTGG